MMMMIDKQGLRELLARSTAVGTAFSQMLDEECILWHTNDGEEFRTTYADAVEHTRAAD